MGKLHAYDLANEVLPSVHLEELTWPEVENAVAKGYRSVIIPTGGVEQNGPHLVLGKHNYVVRYTAHKVAEELGNTLVAPVVTYVPEGSVAPPSGHMRFPGTISVDEKTFESILEQTILSLAAHGFDTFYFMGDSGGNQATQKKIAAKLSHSKKGKALRVIHLSDYYEAHKNGQVEWLQARGHTLREIGTHAGIRDTSEMMVVYPEGVRESRKQINGGGETSRTGVAGNPTKASAEYGQNLLQLKIQAALHQIRNPP